MQEIWQIQPIPELVFKRYLPVILLWFVSGGFTAI